MRPLVTSPGLANGTKRLKINADIQLKANAMDQNGTINSARGPGSGPSSEFTSNSKATAAANSSRKIELLGKLKQWQNKRSQNAY